VPDEVSPEGEVAALTEELDKLIQLTNAGVPGGLDRLRRFLAEHPELPRVVGDFGRHAEDQWLRLVCGGPAAREMVRTNLAALKGELAGPHPTATERLLADLAGLNYLIAHHGAIAEAGQPGSTDRAAYNLKRSESAQRRLVKGLKALAELRAHLRPGLVPTGTVRLHDPDRKMA